LIYQCALIFDEFTAPGRIAIIEKAIAYQAAYNMRLMLIYQNNGQVVGEEGRGYGTQGARTILTNCALKIMFQPKEDSDAKEYSETLGYQTFKARSVSRNPGRAGVSSSDSPQRRALLLPQEVKEIGYHKQLISMENCKPIFADKIIYWKDPAFKDRINLPPPVVPVLEIVRSTHRTRPMLASEVAETDPDDVVNKAQILKAIGDAIDFDFESFVISLETPGLDVPEAA
jgi:type IV secretion system protein VirD4